MSDDRFKDQPEPPPKDKPHPTPPRKYPLFATGRREGRHSHVTAEEIARFAEEFRKQHGG